MPSNGKENRGVIRGRIQAFSEARHSVRKIASKIGCSPKTAQLWKNKSTVKDKMKPWKSVKLFPLTK